MNRPRQLDPPLVARLAEIALGHVGREYPSILVHTLNSEADALPPRALHPVFFGSYDWHSCVHAHWLLARVLRLFPDLPSGESIRAHFTKGLTTTAVAGEMRYFERPGASGFERPYGWAWLLMLSAELRRGPCSEALAWAQVLTPLSDLLAGRMAGFLNRLDYPVRCGVHANTAFALILALRYARTAADGLLADAIETRARAWYGGDVACQAWEPSGEDFLSPALVEAVLMRDILAPAEFRAWFGAFLPRAGRGEPATLFTPPKVSDRGDGKIAHLDGLSLSRAWCWRTLASSLTGDDPRRERFTAAADEHLVAGLGHISGDYVGEHWLASFALLALTG